MSTTRTNDNAQTQAVDKQQLTTQYARNFVNSKYGNRTELIYLFHDETPGCERVDCKVGRTSLRASIVSRFEKGYTYKNGYTFFAQVNKKTGEPINRKRYDPIPDKEYRILKRDLAKRLDANKSITTGGKTVNSVEEALRYFVSPPHKEYKTLYLSTSRFGDAQYIRYPILAGWWAFPYEKVDGVIHDQAYWEKEVESVLQPFRIAHRFTEVECVVRKRDGTKEVVMARVQNTDSDTTENGLFTIKDYDTYYNMYMETCERLGGIWIPFTPSFSRGQTSTKVRTDENCKSDFAAEITKCHWEGIMEQLRKDGIDV